MYIPVTCPDRRPLALLGLASAMMQSSCSVFAWMSVMGAALRLRFPAVTLGSRVPNLISLRWITFPSRRSAASAVPGVNKLFLNVQASLLFGLYFRLKSENLDLAFLPFRGGQRSGLASLQSAGEA